jgi:hypothetical protein
LNVGFRGSRLFLFANSEEKVNNQDRYYSTDHLYLAGYLLCCGHPLLGTHSDGNRVHFLFCGQPEVHSDAAHFMAGGTVVARQFAFSVLKLKHLLPRRSGQARVKERLESEKR